MSETQPTPNPPPASPLGVHNWDWKTMAGVLAVVLTLAGSLVVFGELRGRVSAGETRLSQIETRLDKPIEAVSKAADMERDSIKTLGDASKQAVKDQEQSLQRFADARKSELERYVGQLTGAITKHWEQLRDKDAAPVKATVSPRPSENGTSIASSGPSVPIGTVLAFAGDRKRVPQGWEVCDGRPMQISLYPELYAAVGIAWGGAEGTFFNLPNLNGAFLRGVDFTGEVDADRKSKGDSGKVGTRQDWATGMPRKRLVTKPNGNHRHEVEGVSVGAGNWQSGGSNKP